MSEKPRANDEEYKGLFRKIDEATKATNEEVLTIRDRFALATISFFLDKYRLYDNSYGEAIRQAYEFADAALEVRNESMNKTSYSSDALRKKYPAMFSA